MRKFKYISFSLLFSICWIVSIQWTEGYAQTSTPRKTTTQPAKSKSNTKTPQKTPPAKQTPAKQTPAKKEESAGSSKEKQTQEKPVKKEESISSLKDKQTQVKNEMKKIDESLSKTQLTTKQTLKEIERLNDDIQKRSDILAKQNREIIKLGQKITTMTEEMRKMEIEYDVMKQKYVDLIYHAYLKNNSYSRLLFIMSASSFQESYRRFNYLQQFASLRKQQAEDIETSRIELNVKKEELKENKRLSEELLEKRAQEQDLLLVEKNKQDSLVTSLLKKEKELKKELENQQKIAEELNKKIEELIAKEALEAEKRRQTQAVTKGGYAMTQEEKVISGGFEKNKGVLMWPVKGKITGQFGIQPHPVLKHVTTNNKGIYITAPKGSEASVIYDGMVTQCFTIPGSNNAVIVRHGNYLTVYANLTTIYVKAGDNVEREKKIGRIYEDAEDGNNAILLFQIWKEKDLLNPEIWIHK